MLDNTTKRKIDSARNILVGKVPDPKAQVEQITTALIYKFMDDMDLENEEVGLKPQFFIEDHAKYSWRKLMDNRLSGQERLELYVEAITTLAKNPHIPQLFRDIFKGAFLPFRDPRTLSLFLKEINEFNYDHSENLGNAFEYLLSILGSQGDAGQFRTPRHIIDFIVEVVDPQKSETILDPACGTAGFLISAYKHILKTNSSNFKPEEEKAEDKIVQGETATETVIEEKTHYAGDLLSPDDRTKLTQNIAGYDISPDMVKLALVNLYLHGFSDPKIFEYDALSSEKRWDEIYDVILANPPFMTPKGGISPHKRFSIQANRAEVLFVDYIAEHLSIKGRAGIIVPEGIIFHSANAYKNLRKNLIENWGLYAVVSLPSGVFQPYSGVKTSILLLDRELAKRTDEILFIRILNDGFDLGAQRRKIDRNDLPHALKVIEAQKIAIQAGQKNSLLQKNSSFAWSVKKEKIADLSAKASMKAGNGDYNLTGDRYREVVDYSNVKWPMVELGEVCEILDNLRKPITKSDRTSGDYPYYGATGILDYVQDYIFDEKLVLIGEDGAKWDKGDKTAFIATGKYWVNNHAHVLRPDRSKLLDELLVQLINSMDLSKYITGITVPKLNQGALRSIQIPLPPLEVQEQIVAEIEQYQKVIDGAKQVVKNWKPSFRIDPSWEMVEFEKVCTLEYGKGLPKKERKEGEYPVMGSNGICGFHNDFLIEGPSIIVGRKGSAGEIVWEEKNNFPIDTTYYVKLAEPEKTNLKFIYHTLKNFDLGNIKGGAGIPGLNRNDVYAKYKIPLPPLEVQEQIVAEIEAEQRVVNANKELMEKMEKKVEAKIGEVWGEENFFI